MRPGRALAYPLPIGSAVPLQGRVKECGNLIESGHRLLDMGCSSGWLSEFVMRKGFHSYVGIDRFFTGSYRGPSGVIFVAGSVLALPIRDASFDAACMFDVIEHLPRGSEQQALREARRVLSRGGKLYMSTPHASILHTPLDPVWPLGHRHYRRPTIRRLLLSSGFTVDRLFVAGGAVEGLDHIRLLFYKHMLHMPLPASAWVTTLIEGAHSRDRRLGMTIFVAATATDVHRSDGSSIGPGAR